jgi:pyruvate dehydrogenase E2 component (dihydrolipoamide acetyltransferase)/2-oxoglutarate dehydrogenase E2 component (dihydrolipoamide succinyltransferase)
LASPKARRLALEQGLDLARLVEAGHPQPFHVADLEVLRNLPAPETAPSVGVAASRRLTATCAADGVAEFAAWAADQGVADGDAVLAGLAAASLGDGAVTVGVERFGTVRAFDVPAGRALSGITESEGAPALVVRDLRASRISGVEMGAEAVPVLTIAGAGDGLSITLECGPGALDAPAAIRLLSDFAGRMEQPLRHLL